MCIRDSVSHSQPPEPVFASQRLDIGGVAPCICSLSLRPGSDYISRIRAFRRCRLLGSACFQFTSLLFFLVLFVVCLVSLFSFYQCQPLLFSVSIHLVYFWRRYCGRMFPATKFNLSRTVTEIALDNTGK